jgi:hypothetical protein
VGREVLGYFFMAHFLAQFSVLLAQHKDTPRLKVKINNNNTYFSGVMYLFAKQIPYSHHIAF